MACSRPKPGHAVPLHTTLDTTKSYTGSLKQLTEGRPELRRSRGPSGRIRGEEAAERRGHFGRTVGAEPGQIELAAPADRREHVVDGTSRERVASGNCLEQHERKRPQIEPLT